MQECIIKFRICSKAFKPHNRSRWPILSKSVGYSLIMRLNGLATDGRVSIIHDAIVGLLLRLFDAIIIDVVWLFGRPLWTN